MNKIESCFKTIQDRLPKRYSEIELKVFPDTKAILKEISKIKKQTYKETYKYYEKYIINPKKNCYMHTKYYRDANGGGLETPLDFVAFSYNPILVSNEVSKYDKRSIMFLLLHELAHYHYPFKNGCEKKCDMFAIRWIRKFKEEGIL